MVFGILIIVVMRRMVRMLVGLNQILMMDLSSLLIFVFWVFVVVCGVAKLGMLASVHLCI